MILRTAATQSLISAVQSAKGPQSFKARRAARSAAELDVSFIWFEGVFTKL